MSQANIMLQNVISPQDEMLAYEILWAVQGIKERELKKYFNSYTPVETLRKISEQTDLFTSKMSKEAIKNKVEKFFKKSLYDKLDTFSIIVNKNFQYPDGLNKASCPLVLLACSIIREIWIF